MAASAVACLLPGSATVLFFSAFFQITGLLLFSLFIDRLSAMPRAAIACIASAYAISHLLFFSGLYLPGALGATSGSGIAAREVAWIACAIGSTAFIVRTWRTNATHIELENRCRSYERIIEEQQSEIKKHDEESALLRAAAFGGGSEREYSIACELIAKKHGLTKRETEILSLLARGRDVSFICNELYLARNTVKGYTKRIYAKMDIHSKQEAIDMVLSAMSRQQHATPANQGRSSSLKA
ncbi:MAG: response regulator transcription factor [Slackia sp.]|uniref:helix-turn-helix transcriptional regulator n=1 Tax=Slackia piriformis TaxID=626934 RepID=UPI0023F58B5D|nr:LuxR C-terminal-related transcriptional regulator [Slackia piriformis]